MPFNLETPPDSKKPDFLKDVVLLTSQYITTLPPKEIVELTILGYTIKESRKNKGDWFISVYAFSKKYNGYFVRTYKYKPTLNTKGEAYRFLTACNIDDEEKFNQMNGIQIQAELYWSTDRHNNIKQTNDGYSYINYKFLSVIRQTTLPLSPINPQPKDPTHSDYKTCRICNKKVTNYEKHLDSDCKDYIA